MCCLQNAHLCCQCCDQIQGFKHTAAFQEVSVCLLTLLPGAPAIKPTNEGENAADMGVSSYRPGAEGCLLASAQSRQLPLPLALAAANASYTKPIKFDWRMLVTGMKSRGVAPCYWQPPRIEPDPGFVLLLFSALPQTAMNIGLWSVSWRQRDSVCVCVCSIEKETQYDCSRDFGYQ